MIELHGCSDRAARRYRIHAEFIADIICLGDGREIIDAAVGAHELNGFIFRAFAVALIFRVIDFGGSAAADNAGKAALVAGERCFGNGFAANFACRGKCACLKVVGGQNAALVNDVHQNRRAVFGKALPGDRPGLQLIHGSAHGLFEIIAVYFSNTL